VTGIEDGGARRSSVVVCVSVRGGRVFFFRREYERGNNEETGSTGSTREVCRRRICPYY